MIITKIDTAQHKGCWASDTSSQFPSHKISIILANYDNEGYEVFATLIPKDKEEEDPGQRTKIISSIASHNMCQSISAHFNTVPNYNTIYYVKIKDLG